MDFHPMPIKKKIWVSLFNALTLAGIITLTGCASQKGQGNAALIERTEARYPLFSPNKGKGVQTFLTAARSLKRPHQADPGCEEFISDFLANTNIAVQSPLTSATSAKDIATQTQLDRCPPALFQDPPPPPFKVPMEQPTGQVFERYDIYSEQLTNTKLYLLMYRKMAWTTPSGDGKLHSLSTYTREIDPATCRGNVIGSDISGPKSAEVNDDEGVYLLTWKQMPIAVTLLHRTQPSGPGTPGEIWSLSAQSQFPVVLPLMCIVSWKP
ncbi:hypothetical protein [Nitrospirillum sp. BR 11163]|uniref:hypothetical protein n=1 Tax=Nitrospirillum sp. BR 11163 TaxID=3104323 RepID=UPI002AFDCF0B|nr:hypothetical protein [Nitrospirillum sp. BR 11163]MEA1675003.1 hypothetical protein [Nitrospirillum sp. BR 11163]